MTGLSRRSWLVGAGAVIATGSPAVAQIASSARVGFLFTPARATSQVPSLFADALRDAGWVEGKNLALEWRFADGRPERLADLAAQLVQARVQVIVAPFNIEAEAARRATTALPIVMLVAIDPVGAGFAQSLTRPGGNVTGVLYADPEFSAKTVQILKEIHPGIRRFGYLYPARVPGIGRYVDELEAAARRLGLAFHRYPLAQASEIGSALEAMKADRLDSMRVSYTGPVQAVTAELLEFVATQKIATSFTVPTAVERGGLMSYSPKLSDNAARGAAVVDKLVKGAVAAEMAFEYPTRYELVVNVKTARQLGLTIPVSILQRADRVIEP